MITMYEPCDDCSRKQCKQCTHYALQINYKRALKKIAKLSPEPITIVHCPQETNLYEIWAEGYADNGGRCGATLLGTMQGKNFKDACKKFANKDLAFGLYFDADAMTYWGCSLFDNEADARKSFG